MNKLLRHILLTVSIILLGSCVHQLEEDAPEQGAGEYAFDLYVSCADPGTKDPRAGEDIYNENALLHVDWFVFKSASDTDDALLHGRATPTGSNNKVTTVEMAPWVDAGQTEFYVYAIANLPGSGGHEALPVTLAGLKAYELTAAFNFDPNGHFTAQTSFVMRGGETVTFEESNRNSTKEITAQLARVAAKVSVNMSVAPAIDELTTLPDGSQRYEKTWYPDLESVQVYLSFANSKSTVEGEPVSYNNTDFFTYERTGFIPAFNYGTIEKTLVPGGGYTFSFDTGGRTPTASFPSPRPDVLYSNTNSCWVVTGSPFYSYPMEWMSQSPQAPFLKVILKWKSYEEASTDTNASESDLTAAFFETVTDDDNNTFRKFVRAARANRNTAISASDETLKEFYYKIPLPSTILEANDWYNLSFDLAILGSTTDELPVTLAGQYYVTDWSAPDVIPGGDLKQGSYLSLERYHYYIYGADSMTIPVISSHDLVDVQWLEATYTDFSNEDPETKNMPDGSYNLSYNGRDSFVISHVLNTDITSPDLDCSAITYRFRVKNDAGIWSEEITVIQYPPVYITAERSNSYVFINGTSNHNAAGFYSGGYSTYTLSTSDNTLTSSRSYNESGKPSIDFNAYNLEGIDGVKVMISSSPVGNPGTITVTAPTNYTISKITLGFYTGSSTHHNIFPITFSPGGTLSSQTTDSNGWTSAAEWEGEESTVTISMTCVYNSGTDWDANIVNYISVEYHSDTHSRRHPLVYDNGSSSARSIIDLYSLRYNEYDFNNYSSLTESDTRYIYSNEAGAHFDFKYATRGLLTSGYNFFQMYYSGYYSFIYFYPPAGGMISRVNIVYRTYNNTTYNSYDVTFSPSSSGPTSKTNWTGDADYLYAKMDWGSATEGEHNQVTRVDMYYNCTSTVPIQLGTIRHFSSVDGGNNGNRNIYTISVSDVHGVTDENGNPFYIADPRTSPLDYPVLTGTSGNPLQNYLPAGVEYENAIAPRLKVASSYGASINQNMSFAAAHERCASYQENGYPAGRWRVPTDAEIKFIGYLSFNHKLPSLFDGPYFGASGKMVTVDNDKGNVSVSSADFASVRCVYDAWYWGDDPDPNYMTSWSGWQN